MGSFIITHIGGWFDVGSAPVWMGERDAYCFSEEEISNGHETYYFDTIASSNEIWKLYLAFSDSSIMTKITRVMNTEVLHTNPVREYLRVISTPKPVKTCIIYNRTGQIVNCTKVINNLIDVSSLEPGFYILVFKMSDCKSISSIIKI